MGLRRERLELTIDDQIGHRYYPVEFEITAADQSLEVVVSYDPSQGVVDLGCEGPGGWRGWSGGARRRFVIASDGATPGYAPGELEPGLWHVILGLHKLPAAGLDVVVEIRTPATGLAEHEPEAPVAVQARRGSVRGLPASSGLRWFAGDFHAHSVHSDGSESISELAARGVRAGLDFVAVTDHNTVSHHAHLPAASAKHDITLLAGQEVTTARGHANAFGDIGWVDFRNPAATWSDDVTGRGGILSVNHPTAGDCAWQHELEDLPLALEVWHSSWFADPTSTSPWAFWRRWGAGVVPIGGSDYHRPGQGVTLGRPTTWVAAADRSPEAILEAVRAGRTAISVGAGPDGAPASVPGPVLLRLDGDLIAIDAEEAVLVDLDGRRRRIAGARESVPVSWGCGPFHLEDASRAVLAIC